MDIRFTPDHEWIRRDGDIGTVGITHHAQETLGDVVFVDLPHVGMAYTQRSPAAVVESVKAAADVYMPVAGTVIEVNEALRDDPSLVNADPQGAGWFFRLRIADTAQFDALLDAAAYDAHSQHQG
ncbi:glycine cleavage system protein GcvH [Candidatus Symbiobacter mobilis]|uniref:Glycine cleavage system H protein n=1 Tax=Candidatus Symbiobacter mobilis CR TaxID=946483 RepID=U5NE40_9BURK|nr:glycine cleavage system protein GcvH [Candidatus Symbiobacter mobilis]AGX88394.1 glycine cleavage system protein H [Candidatus Symbiobacter mobilis CR]